MLTGIRDLDREIVNKLSDKDLLQMCLLNKTYSERVCDDSYFQLRTENGFPETIQYKENKSWKNHYLNIVKYIDLLQTEFQYDYKLEDKSPELLYLAKQLVPKYYSYNKENALNFASLKGKLLVVKYLVENGADITHLNNEAVRWASYDGHLEIVKYLVENGADITDENNQALRYASYYGYLELVKYLVENGSDVNAEDNYALREASENGHLEIVKYLTEHVADITAEDNNAIR